MPEVLLVLATSTGGVGRHVQSLAAGLAARFTVTVAAPAATLAAFDLPGGVAVEIGGRPHPARDARAYRQLCALAARL